MFLARLFTSFAFALLFASGSLNAQPLESVKNWTVPPYWMPSTAVLPEKPIKELPEVELAPEAVEAVPTAPLAFTGITPCRVADTRGNGFSGQYGPPQITPSGRDITIINNCGIPAAAQAVSFNFSAVNVPGAGFLIAYPAGGVFPPAATMTYNQNTPNLSNAAVVPLGTGGAITVVAAVVSIDLVIDVNGYYAPQTVVNTVNNLSGAVTLAPGSNVTITPSGQTLTIASTTPAAWSLTGNSGTTPGTNFLGTTDNQALELKVNGSRALRLEPTATSPNVIAGWPVNNVTTGAVGATVSGGGGVAGGLANQVTDDHGTVGGGANNRAGDNSGTTDDKPYATVGGGFGNVASGYTSVVAGGIVNSAGGDSAVTGGFSNDAQCCRNFVGGGEDNTAGPGSWLTVSGGNHNVASLDGATVGGGMSNTATGSSSTIPGGRNNAVVGDYGFAAGRQAKSNSPGSFVWGDSTATDVSSTGANQFIVRASGGIWLGTTSTPSITIATDLLNTSTGAHLTIGGIWTNNSDRASKENIQPVDGHEVLARLAGLPVSTWNYKAEKASISHIGPMAQDFTATFGVGNDDHSITTIDADGVSLAAIQALYELVKEKECEIETLKARLSKLEAKVE